MTTNQPLQFQTAQEAKQWLNEDPLMRAVTDTRGIIWTTDAPEFYDMPDRFAPFTPLAPLSQAAPLVPLTDSSPAASTNVATREQFESVIACLHEFGWVESDKYLGMMYDDYLKHMEAR